MNTTNKRAPSEHTEHHTPVTCAQYLSFSLASEEYAIEILRVQEIRGMCPLTPLPHAPAQVCGVMNLRGVVVPVIDMRVALGLPTEPHNKFTVIIVLSVGGRTMGFVVDSVSDVLALDTSAIEKAPDLGCGVDGAMVSGIARIEDRFIILLDIDHIASDLSVLVR
jgi:purine-binding chemotaxis protein CheW